MPEYEIRKSNRARHMRITVRSDATVIVTIPERMSETSGKVFAESKRAWIEKALATVRKRPRPVFDIPKGSAKDYKTYKEKALSLVQSRMEHFNAIYKFSWKNVSIKNTTSRWGSCSRQGNLNFNYRLIFLPQEYVDYVVVHELCHLEEFNHSESFWKLVEKAIPNWKTYRAHMRAL